jgi:hypothetical protein
MDDDTPQGDDTPDAIRLRIFDAARRLAPSGPVLTRARIASRSRADGFRPSAQTDVTRYLTQAVLGEGPAEQAHAEGRDRSTMRKSIERGRRLALSAGREGRFREDDRDRGPDRKGRAA